MSSLKRFGLVCVLVLAMGAGFGCAKKNVGAEGMGEGNGSLSGSGTMTAIDHASQTVTEGVVYFEFDKFDISSQYNEMLRQKADLLKQYPSIRVRIEGNCDQRGTEEYNLALGGRRARAAYDYLMRLGVNPSQMETISYGKERPAVTGNDQRSWDLNRRDNFQVLSR